MNVFVVNDDTFQITDNVVHSWITKPLGVFSSLDKAETSVKLWIGNRSKALNVELTTKETWATGTDKFFTAYDSPTHVSVRYVISEFAVE
jgi:hypothetical protein